MTLLDHHIMNNALCDGTPFSITVHGILTQCHLKGYGSSQATQIMHNLSSIFDGGLSADTVYFYYVCIVSCSAKPRLAAAQMANGGF